MPGFVATLTNQMLCSHGGQAKPTPMPARVYVMGVPVVTLSHMYAVAGCGLSGSGSPPCATGVYTTSAARVMASIGAGLSPLAIIPGMGTCQPTGQPLIAVPAGQQRVIAG